MWIDKMANLYGSMTYSNGDIYDGGWRNGKFDGFGRYFFTLLRASYEGSFSKGLKCGNGTYTYADGSKYCGSWKKDIKHGFGMHFFLFIYTRHLSPLKLN